MRIGGVALALVDLDVLNGGRGGDGEGGAKRDNKSGELHVGAAGRFSVEFTDFVE